MRVSLNPNAQCAHLLAKLRNQILKELGLPSVAPEADQAIRQRIIGVYRGSGAGPINA